MTTLLDLYRRADAENIRVDAFPLGKTESLSLRRADGSACIAIDPNHLRDTADEKTKLAHELGHCMTGAFYTARTGRDVRARCENRADKWEIRALAWKMLELARPTAPFIFADADPSCVRGACHEGKMSCGNPYPRASRD